jgi:hypothetical protein
VIQTRHEIDALHTPVLAMVKVPADDVILIRVRLFSNTIVYNDHPIDLLNLPHIRLHHLLAHFIGISALIHPTSIKRGDEIDIRVFPINRSVG